MSKLLQKLGILGIVGVGFYIYYKRIMSTPTPAPSGNQEVPMPVVAPGEDDFVPIPVAKPPEDSHFVSLPAITPEPESIHITPLPSIIPGNEILPPAHEIIIQPEQLPEIPLGLGPGGIIPKPEMISPKPETIKPPVAILPLTLTPQPIVSKPVDIDIPPITTTPLVTGGGTLTLGGMTAKPIVSKPKPIVSKPVVSKPVDIDIPPITTTPLVTGGGTLTLGGFGTKPTPINGSNITPAKPPKEEPVILPWEPPEKPVTPTLGLSSSFKPLVGQMEDDFIPTVSSGLVGIGIKLE